MPNTLDAASAGVTRLELTGRELRAMLDPVLAHTVVKPRSPELRHVAIEVIDGALYLFGTDAYTLGIIRRPLETTADPVALTVEAEGLRMMLRTIKAREGIRMDITPDALIVRHHGTPLDYRIPATGAIVIDWRTLLRKALTTPTTSGQDLNLNPAYLARFRAAARGREPLRMRAGDRIVVVTCGEHFIGAICPVKLRGEVTDPFAGWLADLNPHPIAHAA